MNEANNVIFFDGVCNLCNGAVQFIIKRDTAGLFSYSALQSEFAKSVLAKDEIESMTTILVLQNGKLLDESDAVIAIAKELGFPYNLTTCFLWIPKSVRNVLYRFISKNRYRIFGKKESCMVPTPEIRNKFLM